ncbi:hypothetical protein A2U01_0007899, partial [Trifolium medium]|nr:hypothetical protein [Trifolium medium]
GSNQVIELSRLLEVGCHVKLVAPTDLSHVHGLHGGVQVDPTSGSSSCRGSNRDILPEILNLYCIDVLAHPVKF